MKDWTIEERALFEESRRLKEKARGLVSKRKAAEEQNRRHLAYMAKMRAEEEAKDRTAKAAEAACISKLDRDNRVRRAVLAMAAAVKAEGFAFQKPSFGEPSTPGFWLVETRDIGPRNAFPVNVTRDGFQWN